MRLSVCSDVRGFTFANRVVRRHPSESAGDDLDSEDARALRVGGSRRETEEGISTLKNMGFCNFVSCGMELVAAIMGRIGKCAAIPSTTDVRAQRFHRRDDISPVLSCRRSFLGLELAASFARFGMRRGVVTANPVAAVPRRQTAGQMEPSKNIVVKQLLAAES